MFAMNGNILVVDEGVGFSRNLAAKLAGKGYKVDFIFDLSSSENKIQTSSIDLVVISCAGDLPCLEQYRQIREINPHIAVISFEAPKLKTPCTVPDDVDMKSVDLDSWDVNAAAQAVADFIGPIISKAEETGAANQLLFEQGKQVDVQIVGIHKTGLLTSSIARRDDKYLYLSDIRDVTGRAYIIPPRTNLKVGVAGKDAHYNFTSQVVGVKMEPSTEIQIGKPVVMYRTQRRKHPRFPMKLPVQVCTFFEDESVSQSCDDAVSDDLSIRGIKFHTSQYIEPGEVINLTISDEANQNEVRAVAYVLRSLPDTTPGSKGYIVACRFSRIDREIETLLENT